MGVQLAASVASTLHYARMGVPDIAEELEGGTIYDVLTLVRRTNLVDELLVMEAPNVTFSFSRSG